MKKILIINGPNLNLLGRREPGIYGHADMDSVLQSVRLALQGRADVEYFQSNHEGQLIDRLHSVGFDTLNYIGIVLNAGAYTHTSLALADAIAAIELPVAEVHISNVAARESIRHTSLISAVCAGTVTGFGTKVYRLGAEALLD